MALSRPVTALDNERFTVQSVMLHYAVPVVLVRAAGAARGRGEGWTSGGSLRATHVSGSECRGSLSEPACGVERKENGSAYDALEGRGQGCASAVPNRPASSSPMPCASSSVPQGSLPGSTPSCSSRQGPPCPLCHASLRPAGLALLLVSWLSPPSLQSRGPLKLQLKNTSFLAGRGGSSL